MTEKKLIFGGSFNPIHNGHLACARAVAQKAGFDRIVLIPSAQPPHKPNDRTLASAKDRLAMCKLAVEHENLFEVDDIELRRTGPSYSIDTVLELRARGWKQIHWLIGADMVAILPKWHRAKELIQLCQFVLIARGGWKLDLNSLPDGFSQLKSQLVIVPEIELSATDIRARVKAGLPIDSLVPPPVASYVREHHLYV